MTLICDLEDSNLIFQKILEKLNAIGINHTLTKNTYTKELNETKNKSDFNQQDYIHNFEKKYYLNLKQLNPKIRNNLEVLDEDERNLKENRQNQSASYLEINSEVLNEIKI